MNGRVFIIAEAGVNHNGSLDNALALVDAAAEAGADTVKFQTFDPQALVTAAAPQADYQRRNLGRGNSQLAMLQRLVLSPEAHFTLREHCARRGIGFLSSPFDNASARFLIEDMGLDRLKLGSGELTNGPLLLQIAHSGCGLILSTGMAEPAEIEAALGVLAHGYADTNEPPSPATFRKAYASADGQTALRQKVALLHCTTEYPCPYDEVNLRAMDGLRDCFGLDTGVSDHTQGIAVAIAAAARGARIIEKHFTLDRDQQGPDHAASLEPEELAAMVTGIRQVEAALGRADKHVTAGERKNRRPARKSLVAARPIRRGEPFTEDNLTAKRPAGGRSPMDYWGLLGTTAERDYELDEAID